MFVLQPVELTPQMVLDELKTSYESAFVEYVEIEVKAPWESRTLHEEFTVRWDPRGPGTEDDVLGLDLGELHLTFEQERMVAHRAREESRVYVRAIQGLNAASIDRAVPPIPAPQVALALGGDPVTPYCREMTWVKAEASSVEEDAVVTLVGEGDGCAVTLVMDPATSSLISYDLSLSKPGAEMEIRMTCERRETTPASTWWIDPEGRQTVRTLQSLGASLKAIGAGDLLKDLLLQQVGGDARLVSELVRPAGVEQLPEPLRPRALVLLMYRDDLRDRERADVLRDVEAGLDAISSARARLRAGEVDLEFIDRLVAVFRLESHSEDRVRALDTLWRQKHALREVYWYPSPPNSIDRLSNRARSLLVVIRPNRVVKGVVVLDGQSASSIEGALREMLISP